MSISGLLHVDPKHAVSIVELGLVQSSCTAHVHAYRDHGTVVSPDTLIPWALVELPIAFFVSEPFFGQRGAEGL